MSRRLAGALAGALIVATVLAGCGRGGLRDDETPSEPATGQETPATDLDSVAEDLAAVDEAIEQSTEDAGAGDAAAATDDEP